MNQLIGLIGIFIVVTANYSFAEDQNYLPEKSITDKIITFQNKDKALIGFEFKAKISSNFSFTNNDKYVGQTDGANYQFNIITDNEVNWRNKHHEFLNKLHINYGLSKTPQLKNLFKSQDEIKYLSTYLYHLSAIHWFGTFVRFKVVSSMLSGSYISPDDETLVFKYRNGNEKSCILRANYRYIIVESFEPITMSGNLGFFANPVNKKKLKLSLKLGAGFQKMISRDGFVLADDSNTPEIEFNQLEDYSDAGIEFELDASGEINSSINWSLIANFFFPFNDSCSKDDLNDLDRLNTNIEGKFSSKLTNRTSLDSYIMIKRIPLVLNEWQIQNGIVIKVSHNFF